MEEKEKDGIIMDPEEKGDIGEKYITKQLIELGWKVFFPEDKYSISDRILMKGDKIYLAQFKFKEIRFIRPDTGFAKYQYENYKRDQEIHKLKLLVLFTDNSGEIYGEWLDNLHNCEPEEVLNKKDKQLMICWLKSKLKDYKELLRC